jgi:signal transduction histidine kinase
MSKALALEFSSRYIQPLLDIAQEKEVSLDGLLAAWHVEVRELRDETNWVSLRFCEALCDHLAGRLGPDVLAERVTRAALSPKAIGFLYPLARSFGSPQVVYTKAPSILRSLNKINEVQVQLPKRGEARIEYRPVAPEYFERSPLICRLRQAQLAAAPTLWGLPPARVEELECQNRGADRCVYRVRWVRRVGFWGTAIGAAVGLGLGIASSGGTLVTLALVLAGASAGRVLDQRRQLTELKRFNEEQTRGLEEAARTAEQRFLEMEKAKAEVDVQVEVRTAELQETTAQLRQSLERLEQISKVKDEFVANVSHELRTPLTLILGPLEDLMAGRPRAQHPDMLGLMHRNAVRLNGMVTDLLELARLQAGQLRLALGDMNLGELAAGLVERQRPLATRKGLALSYEGPAELNLLADARRLEFAISNLITNAVKFTPAGGRVTVRVRAQDDAAVVAVSDTGPGIPAELHEQVFERFKRFDNPAVPGAAGVGIGLALVRDLVQLHGGRVSLESEVGKGSTFTITLPRTTPTVGSSSAVPPEVDVPVPPSEEVSVSRTLPLHARGGPAGAGAAAGAVADAAGSVTDAGVDAPLVLVVEDHDDMRGFLTQVLRRRYRVAAVASGPDALAYLDRLRPDAILSDVMMPGMSGYELCRRIKQVPATQHIPVVLITARHESRWTVEGFEAGADDYLVKPFNAEELEKRLEVHLRLRRLMDEAVVREKLAALGTIASGLAHEVRNPASAILAGLPRIKRDLEQANILPGAREMLTVAIDCAERISRLVGDVLTLGQPDREGTDFIDVHEGLEVALRMLAHRAPPGVELRRRFAFKAQVRAHAASLTQVFVNLLDNALDAVGDHGTIEVATARDKDGAAAITFTDSGPGVSQDLAGRIFDPFFTTKPVGKGSGLGLHLSRRILSQVGGKLELVRAAGSGACFRVWLPKV